MYSRRVDLVYGARRRGRFRRDPAVPSLIKLSQAFSLRALQSAVAFQPRREWEHSSPATISLIFQSPTTTHAIHSDHLLYESCADCLRAWTWRNHHVSWISLNATLRSATPRQVGVITAGLRHVCDFPSRYTAAILQQTQDSSPDNITQSSRWICPTLTTPIPSRPPTPE